jgi:hypothetical protein
MRARSVIPAARLGRPGGIIGFLAEHANDLAQFAERGGGRRPDHRGGLGYLPGWGVRPELQRPGVHAEQRQPVCEHVMHFPGDALPFGVARPLGAVLPVGLQPLGPLAQGDDQLPRARANSPSRKQPR